MWPLSDQSVARSADDDVFGELDSQVAGESRESFRRRDIRFAWGRITTGMIVHKHNRCRIELQCSFEYDAWIEDELGQAALLQLLVRYETAGSVEEQNPKYFFGKAPHRGLEIGNEFRISRRDSPAHKAGA
ncbi:hypothetical protein SKP52_24185 (plasmid) [Sphingopyxis fribergensis]|uniref:Uncharacterized protein n=1 Tax=Sphingopyxis fribergensis TaxID=1515612 RepID=A0A0A7PNZ1_9SPHN|nr:hypothetical protein SKP52_24185 [Sphingopyxis fribergensis]